MPTQALAGRCKRATRPLGPYGTTGSQRAASQASLTLLAFRKSGGDVLRKRSGLERGGPIGDRRQAELLGAGFELDLRKRGFRGERPQA